MIDRIMAERSSTRSERYCVARLTDSSGGLNGSTFLIPGTTVYDDEAIDNLTGGADLDWYIYALLELEDVLNDHEVGETETDTAGFLMP